MSDFPDAVKPSSSHMVLTALCMDIAVNLIAVYLILTELLPFKCNDILCIFIRSKIHFHVMQNLSSLFCQRCVRLDQRRIFCDSVPLLSAMPA